MSLSVMEDMFLVMCSEASAVLHFCTCLNVAVMDLYAVRQTRKKK
jgi:hypothetical protein